MPAFLIVIDISAAVPSPMGGSLASISMRALSTPMPDSAESTCSTVANAHVALHDECVARSTVFTLADLGLDDRLVRQVGAFEFETVADAGPDAG